MDREKWRDTANAKRDQGEYLDAKTHTEDYLSVTSV